MIFGINGTSDISKLLYVISRAVRRVKFETILNITSGIYAKYHIQIMLLFVYTTTCKWFVIFPCRYFKLSWNTTALSRSNCRNFSCSSITIWMHRSQFHFFFVQKIIFILFWEFWWKNSLPLWSAWGTEPAGPLVLQGYENQIHWLGSQL